MTWVEPTVDPVVGEILITFGTGGVVYVKRSPGTGGEEPEGVTTETSKVPTVWGGAIAVMEVDELTVNVVEGTPPNRTLVAPVKFEPVIATDVPPAAPPVVGVMETIWGPATI